VKVQLWVLAQVVPQGQPRAIAGIGSLDRKSTASRSDVRCGCLVPAGESEVPSRRGLSDHGVLAIESIVELQALYRIEKEENGPLRPSNLIKAQAVVVMAVLVFINCSAMTGHQGPVTAVSDSAITTKMKPNLLTDAAVGALAIDVDSTGGIVNLNGFVDNEQERKRVEARSYCNAVRESPTRWGKGHDYRS
jgi:hypothetical protein